MHLHALIMHLEKILKMNSRLKASCYAHFPDNGDKMLRQINYLSFNCQPADFVKFAKHACTIYARN